MLMYKHTSLHWKVNVSPDCLPIHCSLGPSCIVRRPAVSPRAHLVLACFLMIIAPMIVRRLQHQAGRLLFGPHEVRSHTPAPLLALQHAALLLSLNYASAVLPLWCEC